MVLTSEQRARYTDLLKTVIRVVKSQVKCIDLAKRLYEDNWNDATYMVREAYLEMAAVDILTKTGTGK